MNWSENRAIESGQQYSEGHNFSSTQRTNAYEHSMERSRNILQHLLYSRKQIRPLSNLNLPPKLNALTEYWNSQNLTANLQKSYLLEYSNKISEWILSGKVLKRSTTFVLVPYLDSVYKTPKTHFDLLLLKTTTRRKNCLTCTWRWLLQQGREGCCGRSRGGAGSEQRR
jgi:hypothetical protein